MKFVFVVETKISMNIELDASSIEEAVDLAKNASVMSLCWQCAGGDAGEWRTSGELDADPASSELVDAYQDDDDLPLESIPWETR